MKVGIRRDEEEIRKRGKGKIRGKEIGERKECCCSEKKRKI